MRRRWWLLAMVVLVVVLVLSWIRGHQGRGASDPAKAPSAGAATTVSATTVNRRPGLSRTGSRMLTGRVLQHDAPIVATVWLAGARGGPIVTVTTSADGMFALAHLAPDRYTVSAYAPKLAGRVAKVDLRTSDAAVVLRLHACERELGGLVVDNSGGPIEGARVEAAGAISVTSADGHYVMCTSDSQVEMIARADGYDSERKHLSAGESDAVFQLRPEAVVSGTVMLEGTPVPGALIEADPDFDRTWDDALAGGATVSDENGAFELHGIGPGDYKLNARTEGARTRSPVMASRIAGRYALDRRRRLPRARGPARRAGHPRRSLALRRFTTGAAWSASSRLAAPGSARCCC